MKIKNVFFLFFTAMSLLISISCQSTRKKYEPRDLNHPHPPKDYKPETPEKITQRGTNRFPSLSQDQRFLLYVSANRDKHDHQQVYLLDLLAQTEKRITYQNGRLSHPQFIGRSLLISYQSTTDSDKETAFSSKVKKTRETIIDFNPFPSFDDIRSLLQIDNYEIYTSNLVGSSIERLTQSPGFDGGVQFLTPDHFIYSSETKKLIGLREASKKKNKWLHSNISTRADLKDYHALNPVFLFSKKMWTWLQIRNDYSSSRIAIGNNLGQATIVINPNESMDTFFLSPVWHPSGDYILFSSNLHDKKNFELYTYDFSHNCVKRLTYLASAEIDPVFSPDGQFIYFSSQLEGNFHIFKIKFNPPIACSLQP